MRLRFTKMNGAGNDFVVLDNRDGSRSLSHSAIAQLCDRHRGIGADGLLAVEPARHGAHFRMRYYNADGGEAEMCGNGARCFARFAGQLEKNGATVTFETIAGVISAQLLGDRVELAMSPPGPISLGASLELDGCAYQVHAVNTGVPHAVVMVENLAGVDVLKLGAALRWHPHFAPKGTNANFAQRLEVGCLAIRTYERGVEGETLACGTGVVACALVHATLTGEGAPVKVRVQGGDVLEVSFQKNEGRYKHPTLCGPADFVFEGEITV